MADLRATIDELWADRATLDADDTDARDAIFDAVKLLDSGEARVAEIGDDGHGGATVGAGRFGRAVNELAATPDERHVRAAPAREDRRRPPDARRRSHDEDTRARCARCVSRGHAGSSNERGDDRQPLA